MKRPVPASNFRTPDTTTLDDLRRVRQTQQETLDWIDTSIDEIDALRRSANDWASFSSKPSPTTSDVLLIEDAAASGAKKQVLIGNLPTGGGTSNPYVDPPASPHADNDEFTGFSGWTVYDATAAAVLTDDGDGSIDPWTFPASGHFRRKTVGSYLLIQLPKSNNAVVIYKAITVANNMLVWSRWAYQTDWSSATPNAYGAFGLFPAVSSRPDAGHARMVEIANISTVPGRRVWNNQNGVRVSSALTQNLGALPPSITGVFAASATSGRVFALSDFGDLQFDSGGPDTTNLTIAYAGWRLQGLGNPTNASSMCPIFCVDYFRRKDSATAWVI